MIDFSSPTHRSDTPGAPAPAAIRARVGDTVPHAPAAVPERSLDELGDRIAELVAHVHAATYRLLVLIAEFDRREGWGVAGCRSCAQWLSWRVGIGPGAAREKVRVARALERLPRLSEAMARGALSYSKVRAATRVATPENEADLLNLALSGTASHVERVVRAWRRVDRLEAAREEARRHESRELGLWVDEDGSWVIRGRLTPEVGALLERALEAAGTALLPERERPEPEPGAGPEAGVRAGAVTPAYRRIRSGTDGLERTTPTQRRADAIGLVAEWALGSTPRPAGRPGPRARPRRTVSRADRFQVVLHVEPEALRVGSGSGQAALQNGCSVPAETSRRLACDATRVVMTHDGEGRTLDVGRRARTVPPAIRRALDHRDRGCRFPGCGLRFCDAHHIEHWADGGETRLDNLVLLCRRHHRAVHEGGYRVRFMDGDEIAFERPNGERVPEAPRAPALPGDPAGALADEHRMPGSRSARRRRRRAGGASGWT